VAAKFCYRHQSKPFLSKLSAKKEVSNLLGAILNILILHQPHFINVFITFFKIKTNASFGGIHADLKLVLVAKSKEIQETKVSTVFQ